MARIATEDRDLVGVERLYNVRRYLINNYYVADGYWNDTGASAAYSLLSRHLHSKNFRVFRELGDW